MDWLRLWHDMPTDPKWKVVARKSGRTIPEVIAVYTHMLVTASKSDQRGTLADWDDEDVAAALDMDTEHVTAIREAMQGKVLDGDSLQGWEKRQPKDPMAADRKRRQRTREAERNVTERDTKEEVTDGHAPSRSVTQSHEEEMRGDERRVEDKGAVAPEDWDSDHQLFSRGKAILGNKAGGQVKRLKDAFGSVYNARRVIEAASQKQNPTEYVEAARHNELERQRRKREPTLNQIAAG
jgi:hypothetical protein